MARELIAQGHDAVLLPMYLPLTLDEAPANPGAPIFYGGISVYLQQKFAWFRTAPRWVDAFLNHPALLRWVGKYSGMTSGADLGALTHSMLLGDDGRQNRELEHLVDWLVAQGRPDAIWLSTGLLVGLARRLRAALRVPVICSLQGEDSFLDGLAEPWRTRCWELLRARAGDVQRFIAPSRYYGDLMGARLGLDSSQWRVIYNGINLDGLAPVAPLAEPAVIGYLARMTEGKGLGLVVDAFILLKLRGRFPMAVLRCAGAMTSADEGYVRRLQLKLNAAGCSGDVEFLSNVTREGKAEFLRSLSLLSVPATYGEAFGLYLIEALAAGVPLVQPQCAAFPEIVEATGGGLLYDADDAEGLVKMWELLLGDPVLARDLGRRGRAVVEKDFSVTAMARRFLAETREIIDAENAAA